MTENTAKIGGGGFITERFWDRMHPKPVDTRTGDEIVADVLRRAGIEVIHNG